MFRLLLRRFLFSRSRFSDSDKGFNARINIPISKRYMQATIDPTTSVGAKDPNQSFDTNEERSRNRITAARTNVAVISNGLKLRAKSVRSLLGSFSLRLRTNVGSSTAIHTPSMPKTTEEMAKDWPSRFLISSGRTAVFAIKNPATILSSATTTIGIPMSRGLRSSLVGSEEILDFGAGLFPSNFDFLIFPKPLFREFGGDL